MKKLLLIVFIFWAKFCFSQTTQTIYTNVLHGDTLYQVKIINTYSLNSETRYIYSNHSVPDSVLVGDSMTYFLRVVLDTTSYTYPFKTLTGSTRDSVQLNKFTTASLPNTAGYVSSSGLKTVNSNSLVGNGDIAVAGGGISQQTLNDSASAIRTTVNGKQNNIILTTSGSGAATLVGETLNIPTPAGGGSSPTFLNLGANFLNSTTTQTAVTGWTIPVLINKTYRIEIIAAYQTVALTTGGTLGYYMTSGSGTIRGYTKGSISQAAVATGLEVPVRACTTIGAAGSSLTTTAVSVINSPHYFYSIVTFTCATSGNLQIGFASEVAASAAQLNQNSSLIYQALN